MSHNLADAFIALLDAVPDTRWVLLIDDLHWADEGSMMLLGFVALALTLRARRRSEAAPAPELDDAERERAGRAAASHRAERHQEARDRRDEAFDHVERLAEKLQRRRWTGRSRDVLAEIGRSLAVQVRMVGRAEVGDKPDLIWEDPGLDRLYERLATEFELVERWDPVYSFHVAGTVRFGSAEGTFELNYAALTEDDQAQLCTTGVVDWSADRRRSVPARITRTSPAEGVTFLEVDSRGGLVEVSTP